MMIIINIYWGLIVMLVIVHFIYIILFDSHNSSLTEGYLPATEKGNILLIAGKWKKLAASQL